MDRDPVPRPNTRLTTSSVDPRRTIGSQAIRPDWYRGGSIAHSRREQHTTGTDGLAGWSSGLPIRSSEDRIFTQMFS
ncbi:MAG: hypothetical protein CMJ23_01940 [Phycisphaerae bacterium]|nr:hypothetical protein [Phycisphaerae bacterium]